MHALLFILLAPLIINFFICICFLQEAKLLLCPFKSKDDIVLNLMKQFAHDQVWCTVTWRGTTTKQSFQSQLTNIRQMITQIGLNTFEKEMNEEFIVNKIKTYLRHAQERVNRIAGEKKSKSDNYNEE